MRLPRSVETADVAGKRVLVRADLNVPLDDGRVADDTRIRAALPTLQLLLERDASEIAVCSHLGRPKGPDPAFAIGPVAARLAELVTDERVRVLENTRFLPGETANDPETARILAEGMDLYVNDAFGSAHRAHASTEAVAHLLPAYAGLLLLAEIERRRRAHGLETTVVIHPEAGHRAVLPGEPASEGGMAMARGGSPAADAALGELAWPAIRSALRLV